MVEKTHSNDESADALARVRKIILGGGSLLLDQLDDDELAAMQKMLFDGEAEIINSACKPYLIAKLDRNII